MSQIIIKGARVVDPSQELDLKSGNVMDVFINKGKITGIAPHITADDALVINADGLTLSPGFVDMRVQASKPGQTNENDIITTGNAAVAGGVTSFLCMPSTTPTADFSDMIRQIINWGSESRAKIYPSACITDQMLGLQLTKFDELKNAGAAAVSDDEQVIKDTQMLMDAVLMAKENDLPIILHANDEYIAEEGFINEGEVSQKLKIRGIHRAAEDVSTARIIALAAAIDCPVHISAVSTAGSVRLIRDARRRGVLVTADTSPHYFSLTDDSLLCSPLRYRIDHPLRTSEDVSEIIAGIVDGTISSIASNHIPRRWKKKQDFFDAESGICGLETSFSLSVTNLLMTKKISMLKLIDLISTSPAKMLGLDAGSLKLGMPADIVLFDPLEEWMVDAGNMFENANNTPFDGQKLFGKVKTTIVNGKVVFDDNKLI